MSFRNSILAGEELIRSAIRNPNYVPGVDGWRIAKDGTAEFNNVTVRGTVIVGNPPASLSSNGLRLPLDSFPGPGRIQWYDPVDPNGTVLNVDVGTTGGGSILANITALVASSAGTAVVALDQLWTSPGTVAAPGVRVGGNGVQGLYRPGGSRLGFVGGGHLAAGGAPQFFTGEAGLAGELAPGLRLIDGSAGSPALTWQSDDDTGLYRVGANHLGVVAGATLSTSFTANSARFSDGTAAAPGITFQADTNTGIFRSAADTMQFSSGGTIKLSLAPGTILMDLAASTTAYQPVHREPTFGVVVRFTSSRRYKRRIRAAALGDLVTALRPVTFYPRRGHGDPDRQALGFIAEEVADVDRRLTTTGPDGEADGLDTNAMLATIVAAVHQLTRRLDAAGL